MKKTIVLCAFMMFVSISIGQVSEAKASTTMYICVCKGAWFGPIPLFSCGNGYIGGNLFGADPNISAEGLKDYLPSEDRMSLINTGQPEFSAKSGWKCEVQ